MINRSVIEIFAKDYPKDYPEPESVVAVLRNKKQVKEIPVVMRERQGGSSSIGSHIDRCCNAQKICDNNKKFRKTR